MSDAKILVLDIERIPGRAEVKFWDLGDFKNRRIDYSDVTAWPKTICFAWRWYGDKPIYFSSIWSDGYEGMMVKAHELYDEADVVTGHNLDAFDTKKLRAGWAELGYLPPSPVRTFDTLKVARKEFGFESNRLDALCLRLGIPAKVDHYEVELAQRAVAGHGPSQRRIERYNKGDVNASTGLYTYLRPWGGSVNLAPFVEVDEPVCVACGGTHLQSRGYSASATGVYNRFQCQDCGRWQRGKKSEFITEMRGAA